MLLFSLYLVNYAKGNFNLGLPHSTTGPSKAVVCVVPVCGKVHKKHPLLFIGKNSLCSDSGFPLKKYVAMSICLTSNSRWYENQCVLETSLNKTDFLWVHTVTSQYPCSYDLRCCQDKIIFQQPTRIISISPPPMMVVVCKTLKVIHYRVSRTTEATQKLRNIN